MIGLVIVGHGSLRSDSGLAMIRVAAALRERYGLVAEAGFLNFSRPTLSDALERVVAQGANKIVVQPYFLVSGVYVQRDLPREVERATSRFPGILIELAEPFGETAVVEEILLTRIASVVRGRVGERVGSGLLVMAHGSPLAAANEAAEKVSARLAARTTFAWHSVGFLECAQPDIAAAIDAATAAGVEELIALPYFLHEGRHAREDLPRLLAEGGARWPGLTIRCCDTIGYDERLVAWMGTTRVGVGRVVGRRKGEAVTARAPERNPSRDVVSSGLLDEPSPVGKAET